MKNKFGIPLVNLTLPSFITLRHKNLKTIASVMETKNETHSSMNLGINMLKLYYYWPGLI